RELSVVRPKYYLIEQLRYMLDTQIVGNVPADGDAPFVVQVAITNALESAITANIIRSYTGSSVQARQLSSDPTHVEVRFVYQPHLPLNNITIRFTVDLMSGNIIT